MCGRVLAGVMDLPRTAKALGPWCPWVPMQSSAMSSPPQVFAAPPQEMRAFWLPGKTPEAKALLDKPGMDTLCPASGAKLKLKVGLDDLSIGQWGCGAVSMRERGGCEHGCPMHALCPASGAKQAEGGAEGWLGSRSSVCHCTSWVCTQKRGAPPSVGPSSLPQPCPRPPPQPCTCTPPQPGNLSPPQDLITVKFTPVPDGGPNEYMDPVTKDGFTNASRLVVLKPTGAPGQGLLQSAQCLPALKPTGAARPSDVRPCCACKHASNPALLAPGVPEQPALQPATGCPVRLQAHR